MKSVLVFAFFVVLTASAYSQSYACLPSGIDKKTVIGFKPASSRNAKSSPITVASKLKQLKARCVDGKLVDGCYREIHFYRLKGCWGNPPPDYLEIMEKQRLELKDLKSSYTVIEIACSSSPGQRIS